MHALPIAYILIYFEEDEQDIQKESLRLRLSEIRLLGHASFDVLENLCPNFLILSQRIPRGLEASATVEPTNRNSYIAKKDAIQTSYLHVDRHLRDPTQSQAHPDSL